MSFINKVILITGAGSGIGEATAINFAKSARLALVDKNLDNLNKVCDVCEKISKTKVLKLIADLTNDVNIQMIVETILKEYGKIDIVVNCAGIYINKGIGDADLMEMFDKVMNINLRSIVSLTNKVVPALIESKGNIINIVSTSAVMVSSGVPYNVSKAGLLHFTKCIALELARTGVRVNAILPGPVKTNILLNNGIDEKNNEVLWDKMIKSLPLQRVVKPEEVAEVAAFLASDKANSITGAEFVIDSGFSMTGFPTV